MLPQEEARAKQRSAAALRTLLWSENGVYSIDLGILATETLVSLEVSRMLVSVIKHQVKNICAHLRKQRPNFIRCWWAVITTYGVSRAEITLDPRGKL